MGFWGAALKTKGGTRHKWFGRRYLIVMAMLLATTLIMSVGMVITDQGKRATFNVYISLVAGTSVWMAWRSIVDRDNVNAFRGIVCKGLCAVLNVYALFLLFVILPKVEPVAVKGMVVAFAVLGLATSGSLLYRIVRGADHKQWWLSDHLTAMALNFAGLPCCLRGAGNVFGSFQRGTARVGDHQQLTVYRLRGICKSIAGAGAARPPITAEYVVAS